MWWMVKHQMGKKSLGKTWFSAHISILPGYDAQSWFQILPLGERCLRVVSERRNQRVWFSCCKRFWSLTSACKCLHGNSLSFPFANLRGESEGFVLDCAVLYGGVCMCAWAWGGGRETDAAILVGERKGGDWVGNGDRRGNTESEGKKCKMKVRRQRKGWN